MSCYSSSELFRAHQSERPSQILRTFSKLCLPGEQSRTLWLPAKKLRPIQDAERANFAAAPQARAGLISQPAIAIAKHGYETSAPLQTTDVTLMQENLSRRSARVPIRHLRLPSWEKGRTGESLEPPQNQPRPECLASRQAEVHLYLGLDRHRFAIEQVRLIAPLLHGFDGRWRQHRVPADQLQILNRAILADLRL